MGSIYKSVFGEYSPKIEKRIEDLADKAKNNVEINNECNVTEMVEKYHQMSDSDRLEFLGEINKELKKNSENICKLVWKNCKLIIKSVIKRLKEIDIIRKNLFFGQKKKKNLLRNIHLLKKKV